MLAKVKPNKGNWELKKKSVINWHDLTINPNDIPERKLRCHYMAVVVLEDPDGPGMSWGVCDALFDPETKEWLRYDIQRGKYLNFRGAVIGWSEYPLNILKTKEAKRR